jgi:hypothetical protein
MDKMTLIYFAAVILFILLGVLLNYPGKNKRGLTDDSGFVNKNQKKEIRNDE